MARIFAGDLIDFFEDTQGAKRNVFQIADGRPDKVQASTGRRISRLYWLGGRRLRGHANESSTRSVRAKKEAGRRYRREFKERV